MIAADSVSALAFVGLLVACSPDVDVTAKTSQFSAPTDLLKPRPGGLALSLEEVRAVGKSPLLVAIEGSKVEVIGGEGVFVDSILHDRQSRRVYCVYSVGSGEGYNFDSVRVFDLPINSAPVAMVESTILFDRTEVERLFVHGWVSAVIDVSLDGRRLLVLVHYLDEEKSSDTEQYFKFLPKVYDLLTGTFSGIEF